MAIVITNGEYYVKRCTYSGERMNKTKIFHEPNFITMSTWHKRNC